MKFFFVYLNFTFKYTRNTKFEKDISNIILTHINKELNILNINKYLKSKFLSLDNKITLQNFKKKIIIQKNIKT